MQTVLEKPTPEILDKSDLETYQGKAKADPGGVKRYQLVLPNALYARVQEAAEERDVTVVQLLRSFIKIGLMVVEAEKGRDSALILRTNDKEKELVLV